LKTHYVKKTLLLVGPKPPPIGGGTVNVQILLKELEKIPNIHIITINTSPRHHRKKTNSFSPEKINRFLRIFKLYILNIKKCDSVLVIGTDKFIFTMGYIFIFFAMLYHIPVFLKPLGVDLINYIDSQRTIFKRYMINLLEGSNGILLQTKELKIQLKDISNSNAYYIPGYRSAFFNNYNATRHSDDFRMLFLSQIVREKGPLLLLEALQNLTNENNIRFKCDFYGPVLTEDHEEFYKRLIITPGAQYVGIIEAAGVSELMTKYDVLIFPTYCRSEGHPGVIIEAMHAGIPVISTQFPSVKELITDGDNGFLIPIGDCEALANAIKNMALDNDLRKKMGLANYKKGKEFRSDVVVSKILEVILKN
jgi:glycosyltransferase involved in cell wall biosynthesis